MPDLVAAASEIRNFDACADTPADALGAVRKPPHRAGDSARKQQREHDHHGGSHAADFQNRKPLGGHHLVDVVALRRKHQGAMDRAEALHRHGDRDDHLAAIVDAHHAAFLPLQRVRDFPITVAVLRPELSIERQSPRFSQVRTAIIVRSAMPGFSNAGGANSKRSTSPRP